MKKITILFMVILSSYFIFPEEIKLPYGANYFGRLKNGLFDGNAKLVWSNGDVYERHFSNGLIHGTGKYITKTYVFEGELN
jgi:hypothetical protein